MISIINRKARFNYEFLETFIAGICLKGWEVKSIRDSRISMVDAFCFFDKGDLWIKGLTITPCPGSKVDSDPRNVKLLLRKRELKKLSGKLDVGLTVVPVRIFSSERNLIKMEIALCKGKKEYDKRNTIKEREAKREMQKIFKA